VQKIKRCFGEKIKNDATRKNESCEFSGRTADSKKDKIPKLTKRYSFD
jgi:hypothetical protein